MKRQLKSAQKQLLCIKRSLSKCSKKRSVGKPKKKTIRKSKRKPSKKKRSTVRKRQSCQRAPIRRSQPGIKIDIQLGSADRDIISKTDPSLDRSYLDRLSQLEAQLAKCNKPNSSVIYPSTNNQMQQPNEGSRVTDLIQQIEMLLQKNETQPPTGPPNPVIRNLQPLEQVGSRFKALRPDDNVPDYLRYSRHGVQTQTDDIPSSNQPTSPAQSRRSSHSSLYADENDRKMLTQLHRIRANIDQKAESDELWERLQGGVKKKNLNDVQKEPAIDPADQEKEERLNALKVLTGPFDPRFKEDEERLTALKVPVQPLDTYRIHNLVQRLTDRVKNISDSLEHQGQMSRAQQEEMNRLEQMAYKVHAEQVRRFEDIRQRCPGKYKQV